MDVQTLLRKYLLPPGVVLSLTLVGLILLGALLYSRADRAQRFLEPALAISQPRSQFASSFSHVVRQTFSHDELHDVLLSGNTLRVQRDKLFPEDFHGGETPLLRDIGQVFQRVLDDPEMSPYVDIILVVSKFPSTGDHELNAQRRQEALEETTKILNAMFALNPELERMHAYHFASTALVGVVPEGSEDIIEFHIIPSERPHIDLLQKLQKYLD